MMSVQGMVDLAIAKKEEEKKGRERSGKWSPSSFGKCYRAQYWNRKNVAPSNPADARTLRVFRAGSLFHDFVQETIMSDKQITKEVLCEEEDIKGYADLVSPECVWDLKSQHSGAFHYMEKSADIGEDKKPNILQVLYYAKNLGKKEGRLVFISKDDLCILEYAFPLNEKWSQELSQEISTLRSIWKADTTPDALPRAYINKKSGKPKECEYCSFRDKCKETGGTQWKD